MNVTGADSIFLYGDEIAPIPAAEMRHRTSYVQKVLDAGGTVIRLTYNKHSQIEDVTAYTQTSAGEIYCGDIIPVMEPEGYCVPQTWRESVYLSDELDEALEHWTSDRGRVEWYMTDSREFFENLNGPSLTDFLDEFLKLNPDFSVEGDDDFSEEDLYE